MPATSSLSCLSARRLTDCEVMSTSSRRRTATVAEIHAIEQALRSILDL
jgi:hypothetical protein